MRRFGSRKDPWLVLLLGGTACLELGLALLFVIYPDEPLGVRLLLAGLLGTSSGLIGWCLLRTTYRLGGGQLIVRCGPFRWSVPLSEIESVARRRSPLAAPALSIERVEIRAAGGRPVVQISPDDRTAFLDALVTANPRIGLTGVP